MAGARHAAGLGPQRAPADGDDRKIVGWDEAREDRDGAYADFDPRMAELAEPFFTRAGSTRA
jgi:oligoendopeptidase F